MVRPWVWATLLVAVGWPGASAAAAEENVNPISRVVDLMRRMSAKVEADGKAEDALFEKYECWYKTVVGQKESDVVLATDRISALNGYIDDIEAGNVDFTGEKDTLTKELDDINSDIKTMKDNRKKENDEYKAAKDEMEKSISALESAVDVLSSATKDMKGSSLLVMRSDLERAMRIGQTFVKHEDSALLTKFLSGSTPESEVFGNLAGDSTHSKKYKARSGKIVEILADMLEMFQDNLADAIKLEDEKKATYDTILELKESQLSATESAFTAQSKENGARDLNKQEAKAEVTRLSDQNDRDKDFIKQAKASYKTKTEEYKERKRLRSGEIAAITEATAVLSSDDARDLSKKSFDSQGYLLLQGTDATTACMTRRAASARKVLKRVAFKVSDMRMAMIAVDLHSKRGDEGHFDEVIKSIDDMIEDLKDEAEEDVKTKEKCEKDRAENARLAKVTSQNIDDVTALIARRNAAIAETRAKIDRQTKSINNMNSQIAAAKAQRDEANNEFKANKANDVAAKSLVDKAMTVLKKFYADEGLSLVQVHQPEVRSQIVAGEAPPPPPPTWSEPSYGGAKGEANGIQAIMQMIKDDIDKDIREATKSEEASQADFDTYKSDTEAVIEEIEAQITLWEDKVSELQDQIVTAKSNRRDKKTLLDNTMGYLRLIAPECDFMAENFELRKENRESENDGLEEAKAALNGATFDGPSEFLELGTGADAADRKLLARRVAFQAC